MTPASHDLGRVSDITQFDTFARFEKISETADIYQDGPMLLVSTGVKIAFFNVAFVREPVDDPVAFVSRAKEFFDAKETPWRICVRMGVADDLGHAAMDAGLLSGSIMEGMTIDGFPPPPSAPGLTVEIVEDLETLAIYGEVLADGFGMPIEISRNLLPPSILKDDMTSLLLARIDGRPAATSMLSVTEDIAGVYNVATLPDFRRRGLAAAVTAATLVEGAERGCTIGALQPSEMGRPVYSKLGFVSSALYLQYQTPTPTQH